VKAALLAGLTLLSGCQPQSDGRPTATGTLEYVEIDVAPLAPARVVRVTRGEGDAVRAGDTLLVLTQGTIRPNVEAQQARVRSAEARLRQLLAGARSTDVERANADLRSAQSEAERLARDVARLAPLVEGGGVSRQRLDAAETAARTAAARRDAAQQVVNTLRSGARPEEIAGARSELEYAQAAMRGARATQSDMVLTSPASGTIITRSVEPGEVVLAGVPAMTVADVSRPFVRVYVGPALLPALRIGDSATALLDGLPDKPFAGRIASLATKAEFTPRVALTRDERADLLYAVRVEFVDTTGMLKAGLPVSVRFDTTKRR
jgi:HlyD family secretion protein